MKLLNVGCGGQRPQDEHWWNLDNLRTQLNEGTPERTNLDAEPRYVECDLLREPDLPFPPESLDGVLLQHVIEHFDCHEAVRVLKKFRDVLKPGGLIVVTVPDAEYFLSVYEEDTKDRAIELFGEPIHDAGFEKFFDYALFRHDHKQVLTRSSLWCILNKAGLKTDWIQYSQHVYDEIEKQLTRRKFSLEMIAVK